MARNCIDALDVMRVWSASIIESPTIGNQNPVNVLQMDPAVFEKLLDIETLRTTPARYASLFDWVSGGTCRPTGRGPRAFLLAARSLSASFLRTMFAPWQTGPADSHKQSKQGRTRKDRREARPKGARHRKTISTKPQKQGTERNPLGTLTRKVQNLSKVRPRSAKTSAVKRDNPSRVDKGKNKPTPIRGPPVEGRHASKRENQLSRPLLKSKSRTGRPVGGLSLVGSSATLYNEWVRRE